MLGDACPAPHDIDVMVLGEPDVEAIYEACTRVEIAVHRPVNPAILALGSSPHPPLVRDNVRSGPAVAVVGELLWPALHSSSRRRLANNHLKPRVIVPLHPLNPALEPPRPGPKVGVWL